MQQWVLETIKKITEKERATILRNLDRVPYRAINGVYEDLSGEKIGWWTNGFWGGILWQLYVITKDERYLQEAEKLERKLDAVLMDSFAMDHDNGFRWLPTAVANFALTGNPASRNRGLLAAEHLAGRLNPAGRFLRAWNWGEDNTGTAIIDCMMNLQLLFWASAQLDDPRFSQIARLHADRTMECFVRDDGSVSHIVCFDPQTGAYIKTLGGQGYNHESAWTRGQAWAMYGFALAYQSTQDKRYLETSEKIAGYVLCAIPPSGLIPVDFRQPADCDFEDSTAAAVLACGLIELCAYSMHKEQYMEAALRILHALDEKRADYRPETDGILDHCSVRFFEEDHNQKLVYADYYYLEAFLKLAGKGLPIW